jgi:hypothetical protein
LNISIAGFGEFEKIPVAKLSDERIHNFWINKNLIHLFMITLTVVMNDALVRVCIGLVNTGFLPDEVLAQLSGSHGLHGDGHFCPGGTPGLERACGCCSSARCRCGTART